MDANDQQQQNIALVTDFVSTQASVFHDAFASPSRLNKEMARPQRQDVVNLQDTLCDHQRRGGKYIDFPGDVTKCPWARVFEELDKAQEAAQEAALESEKRGKKFVKKTWRRIGTTASILAPGLAAIPDDLCVLNGGLAFIFSLARHSEMNRVKILDTFQNLPNIIEMARNKAQTLSLDNANTKSVSLRESIEDLHGTLLEAIPALIEKLLPGTFRNVCRSPFAGYKIGQLLDTVSVSADRVRVSAESVVDEITVKHYATTMAMKSQIEEVVRLQREMQVSIKASNPRTQLMNFLLEQLNVSYNGTLGDGDQTDLSERGTALPGFTPVDILNILDIHHLRITRDSASVMRKGKSMAQADIDRAACMVTEPQVKQLLDSNTSSSVVSVDGHFDRTQIGRISPLSYICQFLSQILHQISQPPAPAFSPTSPVSPVLPHDRAGGNVVLEYFCALHIAEDDSLRGPQGLLRCLSTQLIHSMFANKWISETSALPLPHLRDGEETLLEQRDHSAVCKLFTALARLVPEDATIYCIVDGWSAYERDDCWRADCNTTLEAFRDAISIQGSQGGARFKLLLTSPTISRSLDDLVQQEQKVSLRGREGKGRGTGRGGLMGLARVATMPENNAE